jgi:hypothetical protein
VVSLALGTLALVLGLTVSPAEAAPPEKVGWWFQPLAGPLALPVPLPVAPEGGMFVQQGAAGPLAYGAVRYGVLEGSSSALTLTAAPGSNALVATLQACKTSSTWEAGSPGNFDDAPSFSNPCAPGLVAADGTAVAFNLNASFVSNGALDIAIVPTAAATPFVVAFEPPAADALQSSGGRKSVSPGLPTTTTTTPSAVVIPSGGSSSGVAAPPAKPTTLAAAPAAASRSAVADNVLNVVGLGDPDRGARAAALGGASLIVVGWWLLSTQSVRVPRLLGGVGTGSAAAAAAAADALPEKTSRIGGVGRFARTRAGTALKLR